MLFLLWLMSRLARERAKVHKKERPKEVKKVKKDGYYHNPNWYYEDKPWGKEYEEEWI